jgi:hypothetical protein
MSLMLLGCGNLGVSLDTSQLAGFAWPPIWLWIGTAILARRYAFVDWALRRTGGFEDEPVEEF